MIKREVIRHAREEEDFQTIITTTALFKARHTVSNEVFLRANIPAEQLLKMIELQNEDRILDGVYGDIVGPLHELRYKYLSRLPRECADEVNKITSDILKVTQQIDYGMLGRMKRDKG